MRSTTEQYLRPWTCVSSDRVADFFHASFQRMPETWALKLEPYCLSGMEGTQFLVFGGSPSDARPSLIGVRRSYATDLAELKRDTGDLILSKLSKFRFVLAHFPRLTATPPDDIIRPLKAGRMMYQNFDRHITMKYGVIIDHWPLQKLCSPNDVGSLPELQVLYNAWNMGATSFRKLTQEEFQQWIESHTAQAVLADTPTSTPPPPALLPASTSLTLSPPGPSDMACDPIALVLPAPDAAPNNAPTDITGIVAETAPAAGGVVSVITFSGAPGTHKKSRKQRSDKGKSRGPNARSKDKAITPDTATTAATTAAPPIAISSAPASAPLSAS